MESSKSYTGSVNVYCNRGNLCFNFNTLYVRYFIKTNKVEPDHRDLWSSLIWSLCLLMPF